uniref:GILT-like protein C02D5.2 n=1 Tax=Lygus hesperus TaxID=30085 RepID=A0A0A9Z573_LYGHE
MTRPTSSEKRFLGFLFIAVFITFICYQHLYWRTYGQCGQFVAGQQTAMNPENKQTNFFDNVFVDVYYESLCPDSKSFFLDQLAPAVRLLGDQISLKLIPYGKSHKFSERGNTKFKCQHGPRECLGNKYHSCIVNRTSHNVTLQIGVIECIFEKMFHPIEYSTMKCCSNFGLNFKDIKFCANGVEGNSLLEAHGEDTEPLHLYFVPTVVLNGVMGSKHYQNEILKDLRAEVCKILNYTTTSIELRGIHNACGSY